MSVQFENPIGVIAKSLEMDVTLQAFQLLARLLEDVGRLWQIVLHHAASTIGVYLVFCWCCLDKPTIHILHSIKEICVCLCALSE